MSSQSNKSGDIFKLTLYCQVEPYRGDETGYIIEPVDKKNLPVELWEICYGRNKRKVLETYVKYLRDKVDFARKQIDELDSYIYDTEDVINDINYKIINGLEE